MSLYLGTTLIAGTGSGTSDTTGLQEAVANGNVGDFVVIGTDGKVATKAIASSGGSGVSSWHDLTDKPTSSIGLPYTITFDGNTAGLPNLGLYYKVSDITPTLEDLSNGGELTIDGTTVGFSESDVVAYEGILIIRSRCYICPTELANVSVAGIKFPEAGVYFEYGQGLDVDGCVKVTHLAINSYATEKIKLESLPIAYSATDLIAGSSPLSTGAIYLVYE